MVQYISYTLSGLYIEAVPRRILEKMNEKMNVPEVSREKVASHLQVITILAKCLFLLQTKLKTGYCTFFTDIRSVHELHAET